MKKYFAPSKKTLILIFLVALSLCSCGPKYCDIEIISPEEGQNFNAGDIVNIKVTISDDGDAISQEILLVTNNDNDTIINFRATDFVSNYLIEESFVAESNTVYKIVSSAIGGHGNWSHKSVTITCN